MVEVEGCQYCGWLKLPDVEHNEEFCKKNYHPIYLNNYQMGNLIGLFALIDRSSLSNGDWAGEIPMKLQDWCKRYGFPLGDNHGHKIDSTTWHEYWSVWLENIRCSSKIKPKIELNYD